MEGVQRAKDLSNLTEFEHKHVPVIEVDDEVLKGETVSLVVKVGAITHPMKENHHIQWIKLFKGEQVLGEVKLGPGQEPKGEFSIVFEGSAELKALESCTLHGLWEQTKQVTVKQ